MTSLLQLSTLTALLALASASAQTPLILAYPGENSEIEYVATLNEMFTAEHPDIVVQEQPVPPEGYDLQVLAQIAAGTPPDVFGSGDVFVGRFIEDGVAHDLTPFFEADAELKESDFQASVIDYFRGPDGHVYMMPAPVDVQRLYYNKDMFDAAGVEYPTADWTWEDFEGAAQALTAGEGPNKTYGVFADSWWAVWLPYVWQSGGDLISEDGTTCTLGEPKAVEALEWWSGLNQKGYSPSPEQMTGLGMTGWDLFVTGRVAMYQSGGWDIPAFEQEATFNWSMAPLPTQADGEPATFLHLADYVMSSNAANPEAAWEYLKFMASPEVYTLGAVTYGKGIPPRPDVIEAILKDPPEDISPMSLLNLELSLDVLDGGRLPTMIRNWDAFIGDGVDIGLEGLWNGQVSAQEAADAACAITPEPMGW